MANYATTEEIILHGFQIDAVRDTPKLESLCEKISRIFDQMCGVPNNYFAAAEEAAAASNRIFSGDGTDTLRLDPYISIDDVTMPTGWTVPTYIELSGQSLRSNGFDFGLIRTYGDDGARLGLLENGGGADGWAFALDLSSGLAVGWPKGVKVTVSAVWGYDAVPADVNLAVIETVIAKMRGTDKAYARAAGLDTSDAPRPSMLTPDAQDLADHYRNMRAMFA